MAVQARLEALEDRKLFYYADPAFGNGLVLTRFTKDNNEFIENAVVLKYGLVVAQGRSQSQADGSESTVLAMYTKEGKLATGFDSDGKLTLPPPIVEEIGEIDELKRTPDNGILIVGDHGLYKLKVNGQPDKSYGKYGLATVPNYVPDEEFETQQSYMSVDGSIKVGQYMPDVGLISVSTFSPSGQLVTKYRRTVPKDGINLFVDANVEAINYGTVLRMYRNNLQIESNFGVGGVFDIKPLYVQWANHLKPWSDVYGDELIKGIPELVPVFYSEPKTSRNGFTIQFTVDSTAKGLESTYDHGYVHTILTADIHMNGKQADFYGEHPPGKIYGHTYFTPLASGSFNFLHFGGNIYDYYGTPYTYEDDKVQSATYEYADGAVRADDGGYYVFGAIGVSGNIDSALHFAIAKTLPVPF